MEFEIGEKGIAMLGRFRLLRDEYLILTSEGLSHESSCRSFVSQEVVGDLQFDRFSPEKELSHVVSDPIRFRHLQLVRLTYR